MIAYSLTANPPETKSKCVEPVNVTSPNCRTPQTITVPKNDLYLVAGKTIVLTGLIGILVLGLWVTVLHFVQRLQTDCALYYLCDTSPSAQIGYRAASVNVSNGAKVPG